MKNKTIIISESKVNLLKEERGEITIGEFFDELKVFIKGLLNNPIGTKAGEFFTSNGITNDVLINKMIDKDIIRKESDIREVEGEDGKLRSMHYVTYKVPKSNFEDKVTKLYKYFFNNGKPRL